MKALILAGGQGTRLKKYTENLPKGMLSFMGKTIIERQIELYRSCGINDIIIVRGYASEKINYKGIKYYDNKEYKTTNMVDGLLKAKDEFDDDIIVSYSDILFEVDMLKEMISSQGDFCCAVDDDWKKYWMKRYGKIEFDTESLKIDGDYIISLGIENPPISDIDARYIGLLKFSCSALKIIQNIMNEAYEKYEDKPWQQSGKTAKKAYMTDLLNAVIESGNKVKAVHFKNGWIEFDTNEDYENAIKWVEDGTIDNIISLKLKNTD